MPTRENLKLIDFKKVISRSSYGRGSRCSKSLWLHRNRSKNTRSLPNEGKLIKLASNQLVDAAAQLFQTEPFLCARLSLEENKDWDASVAATTAAIENGETVLANPSFYGNDLMCDIHYLQKNKSGSWKAFIVKSSTKVSDNSKEKATFQLHTLKESGLKISHFYFLTINNKYKRAEKLDHHQLFKKTDILPTLNKLEAPLKATIIKLRKTLTLEQSPEIPIGEYCLSPYNCEFKSNCWKHVPKDSVFNLRRVSRETKFKWWNNGIQTINELQQSKYEAGSLLSETQGEKYVDQLGLTEFMSHIKFPVLFLDFEAYLPALPPFIGVKPFQIIPFLFAAYKCESIDQPPSFHSFIGTPKKDPRKQFALHLIEKCSNVNSILVYDPMTEKKVIRGLIREFPEYVVELEIIISKIIDLAIPIRNKQFYLPAMKGLSSMKHVLPAVDASNNYNSLSVQSGRAASQLYQILCDEHHDRNEEQELDNLIEYCKMDVYGLVQVYNAFLKALGRPIVSFN